MKIKLKAVNEGGDQSGGKLSPITLPPLDQQPLVSILIVNYNYAHFVGEAIESALRQTYRRFELIVCDDGSTDDSCQVIRSYVVTDARIKMINKANGGMASALNAAYAQSTGGIICLLDADDLFLPEKLEAVVDQFLKEPQTGLMLHAMTIIDQFGQELQQMPFLSKFETGWIAEQVIKRGGRYRNMPSSALSFRREAAELVFPIPEKPFRSLADGFLFTTLPLFTRVGAVPKVLGQYKIHGANLTGSFGVNPETSKKGMNDVRRVLDGVNSQLEKRGYSDRLLNPEQNLTLIGQRFAISLLNGEPWLALVLDYLNYSSLLIRDDMYGRIQKIAYVSIYGIALMMPAPLRQRWLDYAFGPAIKLQAQRVVELIRGLFHPKPRTETTIKATFKA